MKKLLLLLLAHISWDSSAFSQASKDTLYLWPDGKFSVLNPGDPIKSDTIRATLIVYYDGNGPAILHTKPGFVVQACYGVVTYLDDKKKIIKAPLEVLTYKLKKP